MNNKLRLSVILIGVVVVIACCAWGGVRFAKVKSIERERDQVVAANVALKEKVRSLGEQTTNLPKAVADADSKKNEQTEREKRVAANKAKQKAWEKLLRESPELQRKELESYRASITTQYGPFFYKRRLSPDQMKRLEDALVRRRTDNVDLNAILAATGVSPDKADAAWKQAKKESEDAYASVLADVLGEQGVQQFKQFTADYHVWYFVGPIAAAAARSGIPMSLQQVDHLVDVIASSPNRQRIGVYRGLPTEVADWQAIDELAKGFLSKEQLDMFRGASFESGKDTRFFVPFHRELQNAMNEEKENPLLDKGGAK